MEPGLHPSRRVTLPSPRKRRSPTPATATFAELADRIPPAKASAILEHYGLGQTPIPQSREQKELLVLGVAGIAVSPAQMAVAYRKLALELDQGKAPAVREGLKDSVSYGMAHNAAVTGMEIAGKTGTAGDGAQGRSHGWFAGTGYLGSEEVVMVIYLPGGNGADAARLAHDFFLATRAPAPESARLLTVELFSTRSGEDPHSNAGATAMPTQVEWAPDGLRLSSGTTVRQLSLSGSYRMRAGGRRFQPREGGLIRWRRDGLRVLLTLPSENYVIAALNGEAAPDEPMASLKAMAISIRTFALENANRHSAEGFGLCDSTHCQALRLGKARPGGGARGARDRRRDTVVRRPAGTRLLHPALRRHQRSSAATFGPQGVPATWREIMRILTACAGLRRSGTRALISLSSAGFFAPRVGGHPPRSAHIRVSQAQRERPRPTA